MLHIDVEVVQFLGDDALGLPLDRFEVFEHDHEVDVLGVVLLDFV